MIRFAFQLDVTARISNVCEGGATWHNHEQLLGV